MSFNFNHVELPEVIAAGARACGYHSSHQVNALRLNYR